MPRSELSRSELPLCALRIGWGVEAGGEIKGRELNIVGVRIKCPVLVPVNLGIRLGVLEV